MIMHGRRKAGEKCSNGTIITEIKRARCVRVGRRRLEKNTDEAKGVSRAMLSGMHKKVRDTTMAHTLNLAPDRQRLPHVTINIQYLFGHTTNSILLYFAFAKWISFC